jgi:carbohydrate esterase-like sialic acid-specific acetylesterase
MFFRMADKLIDDGVFDRVILANACVGATTILDWVSTPSLHRRLIVAPRRLAAVGLAVSAFLWMQGEGDHGTSQANYASRLATLIGTPRAEAFNAPWLIGLCTYTEGATDANVRAAQAAAVNGVDIFAGADTDTLTGTTIYRAPDNIHFKDGGRTAAGDLWAAAIAAVF